MGPYAPDPSIVMSDIIGHSERLDNHAAISEANPSASKGMVFVKSGSRMKVESLPILDNLVSLVIPLFSNSQKLIQEGHPNSFHTC